MCSCRNNSIIKYNMRKCNFITVIIISIFIMASCSNRTNGNDIVENSENAEIITDSYEESAENDANKSTDCEDAFVKTIGLYQFTELGWACYKGDLNTVKKLIEEGACKKRCLADIIYQYDVLYVSIMYNKIKIVEYFINAKENVNRIYDEDAMTPLSLACMNNKPDMAFAMSKLLLDAGANVNGGGDAGGDYIIYPLFEAIKNNNLKLVKLLIDSGADITIVDKQDETIFTIIDGYGVNSEMKDYINSLRIEEE